jgi:hypothetical protein
LATDDNRDFRAFFLPLPRSRSICRDHRSGMLNGV